MRNKSLKLIVMHNGEFWIYEYTRVITAQLYDVLKHRKEVTSVILLILTVEFLVIIVCLRILRILILLACVVNWDVRNGSLTLVDDVQAPYSL